MLSGITCGRAILVLACWLGRYLHVAYVYIYTYEMTAEPMG